jgi:hypothetical protein
LLSAIASSGQPVSHNSSGDLDFEEEEEDAEEEIGCRRQERLDEKRTKPPCQAEPFCEERPHKKGWQEEPSGIGDKAADNQANGNRP